MAADATASPEGGGVLQSIAHLGVLPAGMEWAAARGVIQARLAEALASFAADPAAQEGPAPMEEDAPWVEPELTREELCERLEQFAGPPFTIQRLCELLLEPPRHYSTRGKFAYACGKLLTVRARSPATCSLGSITAAAAASLRLVRIPSAPLIPPLSGRGAACDQVTDLIRLEADPLSAAMQAEVRFPLALSPRVPWSACLPACLPSLLSPLCGAGGGAESSCSGEGRGVPEAESRG